MKNTKKRGFTIVELVIVIAVIAVLAAVLIPTFSHLVNKAKGSNDETFAANANKVLKAEETIEGKLSVLDAMEVLFENGMDSSGFVASNEEQAFAWDQANNTLVVLNKEDRTVVYPESYPVADAKNLYVIASDKETITALSENHTNSYVFATNETVSGVELTGAGENIAFYAPKATATVKGTYGSIDAVVDSNSLTIAAGTTVGYLNMEKGHAVVEATAEVKVVNVIDPKTGKNYEGVTEITAPQGVVKVMFVQDETVLKGDITTDENIVISDKVVPTDKVAAGTAEDPYLVSDADTFKMFVQAGGYLKLEKDVVFDAVLALKANVTVDLNGKTLKAPQLTGLSFLTVKGTGNCEVADITEITLDANYVAAGDGTGKIQGKETATVILSYKNMAYGFESLKNAMKKSDKLPLEGKPVVTVVKDCNEPSTYFYPYEAYKVVVNKGVTLTCWMIKMGSSDNINRVILENHGTINVEKMPYSSGTGLLDNSGILNVGYVKTVTEGWKNSGTINLGWNNEDFASELTAMENTGTLKADHDGYQVTFLKPVTLSDASSCGSYKWSGNTWAPDGAFAVKKGTDVIAVYNDFKVALDYAAANGGDTIELTQNLELEAKATVQNAIMAVMTIDHSIKLDLAGHSIQWAASEHSKNLTGTFVFFAITNGAKVTVTGNGTVDVALGKNGSYGFWLNDANAELTIENGTFTGAPSAVQVTLGTLKIASGTFKLANGVTPDQAKYIVNCLDGNYKAGTAKIEITGGTFGFDPSKDPEGAGTSYVTGGKTVTNNNDGTYTVQ